MDNNPLDSVQGKKVSIITLNNKEINQHKFNELILDEAKKLRADQIEQENLNLLFTEQLKSIIDTLEDQVKINALLLKRIEELEKRGVLLC